jgi:glyoxylase-like metal-dependent hydrolase (beta-lactamase superfamily II)
MGVEQISEHVYWMPPGPPDRPSLCAVVGTRRTVMLDAGSSRAHTREFLDGLAAFGVVAPSAVVYTHSHWDHVLGGVEVGGLVIAHELTAAALMELASRDWSDEGLDRRVAEGLAGPGHALHVKAELPTPRTVEVAPADVVFRDGLDLDLGGVTVRVRHVAGDHSADGSVMFVEPDAVLFLGDSTYPSLDGVLTAEAAFGLCDAIRGFGAEHFVEGHHDAVSSRTEMDELFEKMRVAEQAAREGQVLNDADEDTADFVDAFRAGLSG